MQHCIHPLFWYSTRYSHFETTNFTFPHDYCTTQQQFCCFHTIYALCNNKFVVFIRYSYYATTIYIFTLYLHFALQFWSLHDLALYNDYLHTFQQKLWLLNWLVTLPCRSLEYSCNLYKLTQFVVSGKCKISFYSKRSILNVHVFKKYKYLFAS